MKLIKQLLFAVLSACALTLVTAAYGQQKITKIIVPYPPGGASDFVARAFAEKLQGHLGNPVVIENKPGANGGVGAQLVERSTPDGNTLLLCGTSVIEINAHVYQNMGYDPLNGLTPVARLTLAGSGLFVPASHPANNVAEYVAWAKARNKPVAFGSAGAGGTTHVWIEVFGAATGLETLHVPYKGVGLAATGIVGGDIDAMLSDIAPLMPLVKGGRLKILGLIGPNRNPSLPDLPTIAEQGFPNMQGLSWYGLLAPPKMAPATLKRISEAARKTLEDPVIAAQFAQNAMAPAFLDNEGFSQMVKTEYEWWGKVVRQYKIRAE